MYCIKHENFKLSVLALSLSLVSRIYPFKCQRKYPNSTHLKLAGFKAGSGMVPEIVGGTLGMGGLFLAFSSGVWGNGRRPKDEYLPSVAVR